MEKKVEFIGEFGTIVGILNEVDKDNEIVILVHGFSSNKDRSSTGSMAVELEKIGLNSLRIDLDNEGESELDFKEQVTIPNYVKQISRSIEYCKELGYKEISLLGSSFGGICVFATALSHPEIKRMVLRCSVVDYQKHLERKFSEEELEECRKSGYLYHLDRDGVKRLFTYANYETAKDYSLFDHAHEVQFKVRMIQGTQDESVDPSLAPQVVKLFPNADLVMIEGADHGLCVNGSYGEGLKAMIDFFKE